MNFIAAEEADDGVERLGLEDFDSKIDGVAFDAELDPCFPDII